MSIIDIRQHTPKRGEKYFLDCNVLMYLFYTNGSYAQNMIKPYSSLLGQIIRSNAVIYTTDLLISEFVNTYVQTEFHRLAKLNRWSHTKQYFKKTFKLTQEYENILKEIKVILERQLFPISEKKDVEYSKISFEHIFDVPQTFDFNDRYYGLSLQNEDFYIVTHDADFSNVTGCDIITANSQLLSMNLT